MMTGRNSNLRKLAAAYAQGKLDKVQYRNLRMKQLSALDFDKPVPDLPPDIAHTRIPKQGESPDSLNSGPNIRLIALIAVFTLAACGLTYFFLIIQT